MIACGKCNECIDGTQNLCGQRDLIGMYRAGAFAEQIAIPEQNLIELPEDMSSAHAALTEPGATALHAVLLAERAMARPVSESRALVIGAGSVGLLTALILKDKGISYIDIAETNKLRPNTIKQHTDLQVIDPLNQSLEPSSYDVVFDAVGRSS